MRLLIEHDTTYAYTEAARYSIQYLRLTPRPSGVQDVWRWSVTGPVPLAPFEDGFGNLVHVLTATEPHEFLQIEVRGEVTTHETHGVLPPQPEPFVPDFYVTPTALTAADDAIRAFAAMPRGDPDGERLAFLHTLTNDIRQHVDYRAGETHVESTAAQVFAAGTGVCQDHAHLFIACCHALGIPARYVTGYMWDDPEPDAGTYEANHAWAEAYVPDAGWVSFDAANGVSASEAFVRVSVGRDYLDAAPVRGLRRGGGVETMTVRVRVERG